ncbi:MAG: DUF1016 family protein [Acidobacteria bacterium]|nr:MAG: DUF1016 family protein [Acidobacteriota bacterium]
MSPNDPRSYSELLTELESGVECARSNAVRSINRTVIELFWSIGRAIVQREEFESWESGLVDTISKDLLKKYPGSLAFSAENVRRMRKFFLAYTREYVEAAQPDAEFDALNLPEVLTQLPWRYNILLMEIVQDPAHRLWYAENAAEQGWSLEVLEHQIREGVHRHAGRIGASGAGSSPDLTRQILADPFNAEFINLAFG